MINLFTWRAAEVSAACVSGLSGGTSGCFVRNPRRVPDPNHGPPFPIYPIPLSHGAVPHYMTIMFSDLLNRLTRPNPEPLNATDARIALAALLVRIGRSDGDYSEDEALRIDRILVARYGMSAFEATALRGEAETLEGEAPDTVRFTRAIKDAVPHEDRESVVEAMWDVVLADGIRDHEEDAMLRLLANLLGINDRDSALARQRVEARRG